MAEEKNKKPNEDKITGEEKKQFGPFKKRRGGVVLTRDQVKEIKQGRKKMRKEMKALGIKSRKEFELTASSLGLYFDKNRRGALLWWFLTGKGFWVLVAAALLLLLTLFAFSTVTKMRGHFTINLSNELFREGFTISETADFANPTTYLVCTPAEDVPCNSITDIDADVDNYDGQHNSTYFAYTFYVRNEGESTVDYKWDLMINSESKDLSLATWVMVFEDGKMLFYAKEGADGEPEALPEMGDDRRGYIEPPLYDRSQDPEGQYEIIRQSGPITYWRIIPREFVSDALVAEGIKTDMEPMEVHKYTVVIWLEGDDPECTNELIGGNLGLEFYMSMLEESDPTESSGWKEAWRAFWQGLGFGGN